MSLQKSRYWIVVFAFVFALLLGGRMFASVTASISGTVKDATGASIPGATVTATDTGTGISQTRTTNAQGFYSFQELPLGSYVVTVEQKGFKQYQQTNLVLDVNEARTVDADTAGGAGEREDRGRGRRFACGNCELTDGRGDRRKRNDCRPPGDA